MALLLLVATFLYAGNRADVLELHVVSSTSGESIPGAVITVGPYNYLADEDGRVIVDRPEDGTAISAQLDGYSSAGLPPVMDSGRPQTLQLQPLIVNGVLLDAATGTPVAGAHIALRDADGSDIAETRTDERGAFVFKNVPDSAVLHINATAYGQQEEAVGNRQRIELQLTHPVVSGVVLNDMGGPLQGAVVRSEDTRAVTGTNGHFMLEGALQGADITVTAPGFDTFTGTIDDEHLEDITLERAETDAAEDSGWMPWGDQFNVSMEALRPDEGE